MRAVPKHHVHKHDQSQNKRSLGLAFLLISSFAILEILGATVSRSLTLLADAGHMILDASSLGLAWLALRIASRIHSATHSYGYHRFQVLAALVNGLLLLVLSAWIVIEAVERLESPEAILPIPTLLIGMIGLIVNCIALRIVHGSNNLVVRSAALHILGDILGSLAAIVTAFGLIIFGWIWLDPILALVIACILVYGAFKVCKESIHILLEGVPNHINLHEISETLTQKINGLLDVHHLHAWALTSERPMVTLHATISDTAHATDIVSGIKDELTNTFGISHSTVQIEIGPCPDDQEC